MLISSDPLDYVIMWGGMCPWFVVIGIVTFFFCPSVFADKYENNLKMSLTSSDAQGISPDTLLSEYAHWWLERRKDEISASYYYELLGCYQGYRREYRRIQAA